MYFSNCIIWQIQSSSEICRGKCVGGSRVYRNDYVLIIGFLQGMTAGFTVPTAQKFGAGDMRSVRKTVGSAAILSLIVSAIMTVISMVGMRWLLHFMNTPDNIFDDAYRYIMVICAGIFAQVLYNLLASILRALGNSKTPLYFLILAAVLNIILDLVFIIVFKMQRSFVLQQRSTRKS